MPHWCRASISFLQDRQEHAAAQEQTLKEVEGRRETKLAAIENLVATGMLTVTGVKQSPTNPLTLHLNPTPSAAEKLMQHFGGTVN